MDSGLPFLAFGFLSPWLLAGGLALSAVPVVIHLLRRRQYVDRPWAAMQFLQAALRSQARRVRLESMVLLAVRTLIIGFAALALSRPFLDDDVLSSTASAGRLHVLVIDTSLSMTAASASDRARTVAERIVETAPEGDVFALVQIRRSPPLSIIRHPSRERSAVLGQLHALRPTQERGDVAAALRAVLTCLREQPSRQGTEVVLISDFQASNWTSTAAQQQGIATLLAEISNESELTCVPVAGAIDRQLSITNLMPVSDAAAGMPASAFDVTLQNSDDRPANDVPVEVYIGTRLAGQGSLSVPAGETAAIQVSISDSNGLERDTVARIPDDALADDNQRWALLPERRPLEVLLVSGRPRTSDRRGAADFVQLALTPRATARADTSIATTVITADSLTNADLDRFDCVFLCNVPRLDEAESALRAYVAGGGGLVLALGDQVQSDGYRASQQSQEQPLLPMELLDVTTSSESAEPIRLAPIDYSHPVVRPFAGNPDAGLLTTEINRYWRVKLPEASANDVLLSYSNGDAAIVEFPREAGRMFLVTTSLDDSWSNWPLWPSFVPIVHELVKAASLGQAAAHDLVVGDPIVYQVAAEEFGVAVQHQSPDGATSDLPLSTQADGASLAVTIADSAGIHDLRIGPPRDSVEQFAVNVDPEEGRLAFLDRMAMADLLADRPFRYLSDWQPTATSPVASLGGGLSRFLLLVVVGLLLVEQIMSHQFRLGVAALLMLFGAALATGVSGHGQLATMTLATSLLSALALTLFVRTRGRTIRGGKRF